LYFISNLVKLFRVVSRQDERESELRDENCKLHTRYSEVTSYTYPDLNHSSKILKLKCHISHKGKLLSQYFTVYFVSSTLCLKKRTSHFVICCHFLVPAPICIEVSK